MSTGLLVDGTPPPNLPSSSPGVDMTPPTLELKIPSTTEKGIVEGVSVSGGVPVFEWVRPRPSSGLGDARPPGVSSRVVYVTSVVFLR